ncbi:hypothetical protein BurJ1DRAFT_4596 [Burkholderiales bacterium JOSHI_001]|nr:hypothetical protein BurJ1DRAFT_4596 [Burkholderiales bacterium JOSHI_001]
MQRRHLLQSALALPLLRSGAWAAPAGAAPDARFLLVFLRGGYDALSLLVPRDSSLYRQARPNIAIPLADAAGSGPGPGAQALDADWALHPLLQPTLGALAQQHQAVFVPFAGSPDTSRSHFETQDAIELGQAATAGAARDFGSGFLNRLALQLGGTRKAIAFTPQLPLVLQGRAAVANVSLKGAPGRSGSAALKAPITAMYQGTPLQQRVAEAFAVREEVAQDMNGEMQAANRGAISPRGFEAEARRMARLMRERYSLGFIDVGGWDTHVNQGAASGVLAGRLDELGRGLASFADEMGDTAWRRTVVVVLSEFGRTVRENGNRGTDHGHGSVYTVLGGGLAASGPVAGEQARLEAAALFQNRDLPVLNDYRALLGGLFARQFGLNAAQVAQVFPGVTGRDLGLL